MFDLVVFPLMRSPRPLVCWRPDDSAPPIRPAFRLSPSAGSPSAGAIDGSGPIGARFHDGFSCAKVLQLTGDARADIACLALVWPLWPDWAIALSAGAQRFT